MLLQDGITRLPYGLHFSYGMQWCLEYLPVELVTDRSRFEIHEYLLNESRFAIKIGPVYLEWFNLG